MGYSTEFKESVIQKVLTSDRPQHEIAKEVGIGRSTLQYWLRVYRKNGVNEMPRKEKRPGIDDRRKGSHCEPANKLSAEERNDIVRVLNSPEYRDLSPAQIVPWLADQDIYLASASQPCTGF